MKAKKTEYLNVKLTKELKNKLQQLADDDNRSLSNIVQIILEQNQKDYDAKRKV